MHETHKDCKERHSVQMHQMTSEMVEGVSRVHMQAFKGAMNTRLGQSYVKNFLDWFVKNEESIALVAILKTEETHHIVGYVLGAPLGYGKAMNRDLFWVAAWNIIIRPWLFVSGQFRDTIKARLAALFNHSHVQTSKVDLPTPVMSLVGIAVMPNVQGQNIGKKLLCAFEKRASELQVRSLRLSVYPENLSARRIYEKCGWLPCEISGRPGKAMSYSRIL